MHLYCEVFIGVFFFAQQPVASEIFVDKKLYKNIHYCAFLETKRLEKDFYL